MVWWLWKFLELSEMVMIVRILFTAGFKSLYDQSQAIVKDFKNSPLQYSHLKVIQLQQYGELHALCLSVITRWGTQFRLFQSLLRNKEALRQFVYEKDRKSVV